MKLDLNTVLKYLVLGLGAVAMPIIVGMIGVSETLAQIPMWNQDLWSGLTLGTIVLAGAGVLLVDQLLYNK